MKPRTLACTALALAASMASAGTDPTRPLSGRTPASDRATPDARERTPRVVSVLINHERRVAIVGDQIVAPGDRIGRYQVQSIDREGVWLVAEDGGRVRLGLELPTLERLMSEL